METNEKHKLNNNDATNDPDVAAQRKGQLDELRQKVKRIYITLSVFAVIGIVVFFIISKANMILGYLLGCLVTAGLIGLVFYAFTVALRDKENYKVNLLTGPLPKAGIMLIGVFICKMLPSVFDLIGYIVGIALYLFVFGANAIMEHFQNK